MYRSNESRRCKKSWTSGRRRGKPLTRSNYTCFSIQIMRNSRRHTRSKTSRRRSYSSWSSIECSQDRSHAASLSSATTVLSGCSGIGASVPSFSTTRASCQSQSSCLPSATVASTWRGMRWQRVASWIIKSSDHVSSGTLMQLKK